MQRYDFVIAGGGLAGLSLACHLARSPLRERSILIVDKDAAGRNDRTWCFWADGPGLFDEAVSRSWDCLRVTCEESARVVDLHGYRYHMIRGEDFHRVARRMLAGCPNVTFRRGVVERIEDDAGEARVTVDGETVAAGWAFDSTFKWSELRAGAARDRMLKLHFRGWEIETPGPAFDPRVPTFLDFRTPQASAVRFYYVLPVAERRALVEYVLFSPAVLGRDEYEAALRAYLERTLGIAGYRVVREEGGVLPATDRPFARRLGRRVMAIGTAGGRVKPTTGYAFMRVQQDSAAIVESLARAGHPFDIPADSRRYRLYDRTMLEIMASHAEQIGPLFGVLFERNPIERVLRFLDEAGSPWENLQLIATLPPWPFLQALARLPTSTDYTDEHRYGNALA